MQPFLKTVAATIHDRYSGQLHRILVVFPNRRQGVFFKSYLQQIINPPAFLPELLTIEEFVQRSSPLAVADRFVQSFALYEAYAETLLGKGREDYLDYEKFFPIAEILLRDFQELDAYLANTRQVFEQLRDIEAIEKSFDTLSTEQKDFLTRFWSSFSSEKMSSQQQKFLELWTMLPDIYDLFHQKLQAQNLTTLGMLYRELAFGKQARKHFAGNWEHIAFVGFNAFNKAEENWIGYWQQQGKVSLWLDADRHYTINPQHEAGHFIRRNLNKLELKNELPLLDVIGTATTPVTVISAQGATTQAKLIPQLLAEFSAANATGSIAIILADEGLLLPVLQSLPPAYGNVNVTMGFPLKQSVFFSLLQLFFQVQADLAAHYDRNIGHEYVHAFMQHPLCDWPDAVKQAMQIRMVSEVLLRVPLHQLQGHSDTGNYFFSPLHTPADVFSRLLSLVEAFHRHPQFINDHLLQGLLVQAWQTIQQLQQLFADAATQPLFAARPGSATKANSATVSNRFSLTFLTQSIRKQLASMIVPFEGEPLQGIQVMGLLESRGLDFDHIIILNANEGALPGIQAPVSFIPDGIRRAFGLSIREHQDAIFAYSFYRLLHRCQSMTMVYNATINEQSTGEMSRYIPQLEFETAFRIQKTAVRFRLESKQGNAITIQKTSDVMKHFNPYFFAENQKTFSPSAINSYLLCQLQFYFRYIARLQEPDEIQDEVDARVFGTIVHTLMECLYEAAKEKNGHWTISKTDIGWMKGQVDNLLQQAFIKGWREKSKEPLQFTGRLLVVAEVVKQYAHAYLDYDATNAPFTTEALETRFREPFNIKVNGKTRPVFLSGYIDRIDKTGDVYRMVDYKTGQDELEFTTVERLFDRNENKRNKAALQTLIYAWSFRKMFPGRNQFEPALLPLRVMQLQGGSFIHRLVSRNGKEKVEINPATIHGFLDQLEVHLRTVLEEMMDVSVPFAQTEDRNTCGYCPYAGICGRTK